MVGLRWVAVEVDVRGLDWGSREGYRPRPCAASRGPARMIHQPKYSVAGCRHVYT
jgi:hypothetical protein